MYHSNRAAGYTPQIRILPKPVIQHQLQNGSLQPSVERQPFVTKTATVSVASLRSESNERTNTDVDRPSAAGDGPTTPVDASSAAVEGQASGDTAMTLANTKEKTPMCLINELSRFNKIQHQYTLTDEQGPAHKKIFFVKLKLGDEEYTASGQSIKKAQHAAAVVALEKTQFKRPPPKRQSTKENVTREKSNITPTVELNALAMKRGELTVYQPLQPPGGSYRSNAFQCSPRYNYMRQPRCSVLLRVGTREFVGEGGSMQAARHHAAGHALLCLRDLPMPVTASKVRSKEPEEEATETEKTEVVAPLKSAVSQVHEMALKRNFAVKFDVIKESGPAHMRSFITQCTCGTFTTEGESNSKKQSKKKAAENMLTELQKLPELPATPVTTKPKKNQTKPKQNKNLIKLQKASKDYGAGINPISRLIQIQQAKKGPEPVYTLVGEKGVMRFREFTIQVSIGGENCTGTGSSKKIAKLVAADNMLQKLGYTKSVVPVTQPSKPALKSNDSPTVNSDKKVTFKDPDVGCVKRGEQLTPGIIKFSTAASEPTSAGNTSHTDISKPLASVLNNSDSINAKAQLLYLAEVFGFKVQFSDFPRGTNKTEVLSLVTLNTNPPQVSHGSGSTVELANEAAAVAALKTLSQMGLNGLESESNKSGIEPSQSIKTEEVITITI